jgi:hypothetical protein
VPSSPPTLPSPDGNRPTFMSVFASIPASLKKTSILPLPRALSPSWWIRSPISIYGEATLSKCLKLFRRPGLRTRRMLSTKTPPKGPALLSPINTATTPRRGAFADLSRTPSGADLPASAHSSRLACPACPALVAGGPSRGSRSHQRTSGAGGRGVSEAKRIRSHYFASMTGRPPGLCTPLRYKAGPHSIL